jgi:hypothetical protein
MVRTHLRPTFDGIPSDKLGQKAIEEWVGKLADQIAEGTLAPKSFNNVLNLLAAILKWARGSGYLPMIR